ncbi:50S ribosomal protein L16, chloroplastic [Lathyrus oleraceus]|uniref:50S ribosomal protein L16, chloroplastic n=1 Tax=Pisum sativum TaxID=3888 RepID=A0A9D4X9L0_PEA|nr:50S ribosomal protein L16, chloroplastic-like [Pisum sativum]KAI5416059.1 hypothetical protein KIW84_041197 [Pisum sativum]
MSEVREWSRVQSSYLKIDEIGEENVSFSCSASQNATKREEDEHEVFKALESAWITSRQLEAGRREMSQNVFRGGQIWVHIFRENPITVRPTKTRMGSGKGLPEYWVAVVKPAKILYEVRGVP